MADNSQHVYNWLTSHGYAPHQAAALLGHAMQESGIQPTGATGDHGTAHGLMQWRGDRFQALQDFARQQGTSWRDMDTQLGFLDHELHTTEKAAGDRLRAATNVRDATRAGMAYERPRGYTAANPEGGDAWNRRFGYAENWASRHGAPQQTAAIPLPQGDPRNSLQLAASFGAPNPGREPMAPTAPVNLAALDHGAPSGVAAAFSPAPAQDWQNVAQTPAPTAGVAEMFGAAPTASPAPAPAPIQVAQAYAPTPAPTPAPVTPTTPMAAASGGLAGLAPMIANMFAGVAQPQPMADPFADQKVAAMFTDNSGQAAAKSEQDQATADERRRRLAYGAAQPAGAGVAGMFG